MNWMTILRHIPGAQFVTRSAPANPLWHITFMKVFGKIIPGLCYITDHTPEGKGEIVYRSWKD